MVSEHASVPLAFDDCSMRLVSGALNRILHAGSRANWEFLAPIDDSGEVL
jgi:hypothetical protein